MVGASRERVNKAIALFVKLGWLEISGRSRYRIVNREELEIRARSVLVAARLSGSLRSRLRDEPDSGELARSRFAHRSARRRSRRSVGPHADPSSARPRRRRRRRRGGRRGRGRGRSRARRPRRRRSRSRCGRSTPRAAPRCRPAGVHGSFDPEERERRAPSARRPRAARCGGPGPCHAVGRAHHAVERDGRVEPVDRRGLERVVPAHAEAEHRDARDVVVDDEQVGGGGEHVHLLGVVEILARAPAVPRPMPRTDSRLTRRTARSRRPRARAWRGGGPCPRTTGAARRCRDAARARRSACRRAGRARPRPRARRRRAGGPRR